MMNPNYIYKKAKLQIYITLIKPAMINDCGSWTISKQMQIKGWETKINRMMYGPFKLKIGRQLRQ